MTFLEKNFILELNLKNQKINGIRKTAISRRDNHSNSKSQNKLTGRRILKRARVREPQFRAIPGLIQKYYIKTGNPVEYGGVYIWDSAESLIAFKNSDLAKTIAVAYETVEAPNIEIADILFKLRE